MEKLGFNLSYMQLKCYPNGFSVKTVAQVGMQMLDRLEALHDLGYIHLDIKPDNLCIQQHIY